MRSAAARVAHVMKAVEHCDQVEIGLFDLFGRGRLETDAVAQPVGRRMSVGLLDGADVKVVADEVTVRKSLGHDQRRKANAASNVCDFRTALQPWEHPI